MIPFFDAYGAILTWVFEGHIETNERTKVRVRVGRGGTSFRVDLSDGMLPTVGFRKTFPKSAAAEVAWYLQGTQDASFIRKYAPLWDKFVEPLVKREDLFNGDEMMEGVKAAYGYRWRRHFGRDQIRLAIEALRKDSSDRRCFVSAWDPAEDGLGELGQRNVPCPAAFTFSVLNGELHSSLMLRSSDVFVGLPYDVMGHALLMDAVAAELRIKPGVMHVTLAHAHLYEFHWQMTMEALHQEPVLPKLQLPGWSVSQIERDPDDYVLRFAEEAKRLTWPTFNPKPEVVE
ncbi:putative thymidylate synthase [Xanthomonas phage vB_Xar_IVIA-DoCa5]|uniref:thymidylate synthase n=1 Tax=Xanthomonas phage vB_Xar_IVIA-DoCa5 TaxID=2975532 RepID=A0A9X9JQS3_9CAUD|nr:putative thymidylate synthase [Xanthomonas phage vB_Xar_IVIA-DoCa5]UYA98717.1 putative thymidylate synthase [Xanthomonas phage vB_Xar_IVIA-DoCa5]